MKHACLIVLSILLMLPSVLHAEELQESKPTKGWGLLGKIKTFIDTMSVKGIDRRYIDIPERPWQVLLRSNINQSGLVLKSTVDGEALFSNTKGEFLWEPRIKTSLSTYAGFWVGYRGYGLGYSWNVAGDDGQILTFGVTGGCYGLNLRIHHYESDNPKVHYGGLLRENANMPYEYHTGVREHQLSSPISTRTLMLDGYYFLNGKHFSYAAAYDQSAIQKRSAGSIMVGAMYYYARIKYNDNENADFILLMDNIGLHKMWQFGVGAGYAYNWVPCRGLLVSGMAIPMLMFYNHHKTWRYDSNLRQLALDIEEYDEEDLPKNEWVLYEEPLSVTRNNSRVTWNLDCRLSITYQWSRFYLNANGQYSTIQYKEGNVKGHLFDWFINASAGVRF